ncbi:hypothetical protein KAW38_00450 [Candidatus Micrarchaeota archaeon]|nr:hypothetical protein [Candidatus Micrarchaeota archaeon]
MRFLMVAVFVLAFSGCVIPLEETGKNLTGTSDEDSVYADNKTEQPVENKTIQNMTGAEYEEEVLTNVSANITVNGEVDLGINITENENIEEDYREGLLVFGDRGYALDLLSVTIDAECAVFEFIYTNGTVIDKAIICKGEDIYWVSPEGQGFRVKVLQVALGYSTNTSWANVIIYG